MSKSNLVLEEVSASSRWAKFWAKNAKANQFSCEPAKKVLDEASNFRKQMDKRIDYEEKRFVERADAKSLGTLLSGCLDDAQVQRDETHASTKLTKRVGKKTVVFVNNFAGFLQAYSGIVEIMQGADQQYGGLAYSVLSLLLIVAVNKQQKEDHIDSALLTLQREYARLELLRDVHSSDTMKRAIADAYSSCIEFAEEVTLYYSRPTYLRVLEAFTKPPRLGIDKKIAAITEAMTEVRTERATLDSKRLHQVQQSMGEVQRNVNEINGAVEALHLQNEKRSLEHLKKLLLPEGYNPNSVLDHYSSLVNESFQNIGRLTPMNVERLMQNPSFRTWEVNRKSCMMLLFGRTAITTRDLCWLSPIIFHLIEIYRRQDRVVVFHCCHDRVFMEPDVYARAVLSSLVCQLLEAKPSMLRDQTRYQELSRSFSDPRWHESPPKMPFEVLGELLDSFPEVYILLDRVDRIKGDADRFLDPMVNLVKKSKCFTKIFLVASSNYHAHPDGKMTPEVLMSIEEGLGSDRFSSLNLNQK